MSVLSGQDHFDPVDPCYADVVKGNTTFDNFRFTRCWWEVPKDSIDHEWVRWQKGGEYQPFFASTKLTMNWKNNGREILAFGERKKYTAQILQSNSFWFGEGLVAPDMNTDGTGFNIRILPRGQIFSAKSSTVFVKDENKKYFFLGLLNTSIMRRMLFQQGAGLSGNTGKLKNLPVAEMSVQEEESIISNAKNAVLKIAYIESKNETSPYFSGVSFDVDNEVHEYVNSVACIEDISAKYYAPHNDGIIRTENLYQKAIEQALGYSINSQCFVALSYLLGKRFGRWKDEPAGVELTIESLCSVPPVPPVFNDSGKGYLSVIEINYDQTSELTKSFSKDLEFFDLSSNEQFDLCRQLTDSRLFFDFHLKIYSCSQQAPIYWPLQTPSSSYTLWVYYHRLNEQTLYTCVNDFVEPKLTQVEQDLNGLRSKSARSSQEEKELEKLSDLASELRDFRDELLRLAKFWKPNLNDGVQITAAPLWKLFQHKAWQKKLKETWESLEKGDYDWAHLARSIWPERVLRKCHQDRSLAIAHDVEEHFWHEVEVPVKRGKKLTGETKQEWQPKNFSEAELTALVKKLAEEVE